MSFRQTDKDTPAIGVVHGHERLDDVPLVVVVGRGVVLGFPPRAFEFKQG